MFVIRKSALIAAAIFFAAALFAGVGISEANAASKEYERYTVVLDAGPAAWIRVFSGLRQRPKKAISILRSLRNRPGIFPMRDFG